MQEPSAEQIDDLTDKWSKFVGHERGAGHLGSYGK